MTTSDPMPPRPRLVVCMTCKAGLEIEGDDVRPGKQFFDALTERCQGESPAVDLMPVDCLSLCDHGCSAAISVEGKWSYLLGGLSADLADDVITYARAYALSRTGLVLPSKRPASLANMVKARMPPT
jgi:predicted metal-binding protein